MYCFHKCQPHSKCPNLTDWYLEIRPEDAETVMKVHKSITYLYFFKFGMDPHIQDKGAKLHKEFYNPIHLAAMWLQTVEHYLITGETILVNSSGGIIPLDDTIILETVQSNDIHWHNRFDDEKITISRWPQGKHWYLSSNKHRVFVPGKYDTYAKAHWEAGLYVPVDRIETKECTGVLPPE